MPRVFEDLSGRVFGKLTVIALDHFERYRYRGHIKLQSYYLCRCECGEEKVIFRSHLTSGSTVSCGCWRIELNHQRSGENSSAYKHGHATRENAKTYDAWASANKIRKRNVANKKAYDALRYQKKKQQRAEKVRRANEPRAHL